MPLCPSLQPGPCSCIPAPTAQLGRPGEPRFPGDMNHCKRGEVTRGVRAAALESQ